MTQTPARHFEVLVTAHEAFPAFEREFLTASHNIIAGFRIFDPWTTLRSDDAKAIGTTWFDLIVDTLNRGVKIDLTISDFDPVVRAANHKATWQSLRGLHAAAQASRNPHLMNVRAAMHPARVGILPRLALWPRLIREINDNLRNSAPTSNDVSPFLKVVPALRPLLRHQSGTLRARRFPPPPLVPVTHHQKLAVFDNKRLYVGGLDLNDRRFDTPDHDRAAHGTWHDTQVIVDGPIAAEAAQHLTEFQQVADRGTPSKTTHLLRTLSGCRSVQAPFLSPRPVLREIAEAHEKYTSQAHTLIYLESQFFRDRPFAQALAKRARAVPDLTLILILPAAPEEAAFYAETGSDVAFGEHLQTECIDIVQKAFGSRVFIGSPARQVDASPADISREQRATLCGAPIIYLHAKVSIFDDAHGIISSANLNGRSFNWDTEAGLATQTLAEVQTLKRRSFDHWLGTDTGEDLHGIETAQKAWGKLARHNASVAPTKRIGAILPYDGDPAADLASNLPGVPEEMV